jgi:hypothetical protein
VVGAGNSAGEVGSELARAGARVTLSVRSGAVVLPRQVLGVPVQYFSLLMTALPRRSQRVVMDLTGRVAQVFRGRPSHPARAGRRDVLTLGGEPSTADEHFTVLRNDRVVGLLRLDFASVISMAAYYLVFCGIYAVLRRAHAAYVAVATALVFVGITLWLATHSALSMIFLSDRYPAATTDARRSHLLAAGEAVIASDMWHSSGPLVGGILLLAAAVMISVLMLRSSVFSRFTAIAGILANGLDLVRTLINLLLPGNPADILMAIAGPFYLVWLILLGRRLLQLGHDPLRPRARLSPVGPSCHHAGG